MDKETYLPVEGWYCKTKEGYDDFIKEARVDLVEKGGMITFITCTCFSWDGTPLECRQFFPTEFWKEHWTDDV